MGIFWSAVRGPSTKLQEHFDKLSSDSYTYTYVIWDYSRICEEVCGQDVTMKQFFPAEYERQKGLVERVKIDEWARQFGGAISHDALAALNDIVLPALPEDEVKH